MSRSLHLESNVGIESVRLPISQVWLELPLTHSVHAVEKQCSAHVIRITGSKNRPISTYRHPHSENCSLGSRTGFELRLHYVRGQFSCLFIRQDVNRILDL